MFEDLLGKDDHSAIDVLKFMLTKDEKHLPMMTDLNISQIQVLTVLEQFINQYPHELSFLKDVLNSYLAYMISLKRKSRTETIKGISEMREKFLEENMALGQLMQQGKR